MESDKEALNKIVSERADKIQSEALEQIKHIQDQTDRELSRIVPDIMKQVKNFSVFKLLDVLDVLRNGGVVKTCDYTVSRDNAYWTFSIDHQDLFYESPHKRLGEGNYRITLIMEKLAEKAEG